MGSFVLRLLSFLFTISLRFSASFSGSLQLLGRGGDSILSAPFERAKQLSTLVHVGGQILLVSLIVHLALGLGAG